MLPDFSRQGNFRFDSFEAARAELLRLGRAVEVLEPTPLRRTIQDYAEQIIWLYNQAGG